MWHNNFSMAIWNLAVSYAQSLFLVTAHIAVADKSNSFAIG